jgi:hypothetical protein
MFKHTIDDIPTIGDALGVLDARLTSTQKIEQSPSRVFNEPIE